jgi:hypothetical protein
MTTDDDCDATYFLQIQFGTEWYSVGVYPTRDDAHWAAAQWRMRFGRPQHEGDPFRVTEDACHPVGEKDDKTRPPVREPEADESETLTDKEMLTACKLAVAVVERADPTVSEIMAEARQSDRSDGKQDAIDEQDGYGDRAETSIPYPSHAPDGSPIPY